MEIEFGDILVAWLVMGMIFYILMLQSIPCFGKPPKITYYFMILTIIFTIGLVFIVPVIGITIEKIGEKVKR